VDRRRLLVTALAGALAAPLAAEAQPAGKIPNIGVLASESPDDPSRAYALRDGLRDVGYVEDRNIRIEWRWARGRAEAFQGFASELARLNVDVLVASNNSAIRAAQQTTKTIPIVMVYPTDPVELRFVTSLRRPGGNTTGLTSQSSDLSAKRLQLLKEAVPNVSRVAVLWDPAEPGRRAQATAMESAGRGSGLQVALFEVRRPTDLDNVFAAMTRQAVGAVLVGASTMTFARRARLADLALRNQLPTMCLPSFSVEAGCLMSYDAQFADLYRRAAAYVDKILKGAKPADLPIEQPTKFELAINMKTAKALGLTIPPSLLARADQVIE
jgi:putative ABC transport system substrate-binding protein